MDSYEVIEQMLLHTKLIAGSDASAASNRFSKNLNAICVFSRPAANSGG
jgi:hypothetical protein